MRPATIFFSAATFFCWTAQGLRGNVATVPQVKRNSSSSDPIRYSRYSMHYSPSYPGNMTPTNLALVDVSQTQALPVSPRNRLPSPFLLATAPPPHPATKEVPVKAL